MLRTVEDSAHNLQKLRSTADKFSSFKFIQITDASDISSTNNELVKTITKLQPAELYHIQFHKDENINAVPESKIDSSLSDSCLITTSEIKPTPPTNIKIQLKTFSTAKVTFSPPKHPNGQIMKYIINYRKKGSRRSMRRGILDVAVQKFSDLELIMTGLFQNKLYEVQIACQNYGFTSEFSNWVEFRVELRKFKTFIPLLDHNWTPILSENDDIYTQSFKESVSGIVEQMFLEGIFSSSFIEVVKFQRRFDNTTLAETNIFVSESTIDRVQNLKLVDELFSFEYLSNLFQANKQGRRYGGLRGT